MKNDKLLTELRKIETGLLNSKEPSAYISLQNLITEVEDEIRDECNKASGNASIAKAAERILKTARGSSRDMLHKAYRSKKGLYVCDGVRAIRFNLDTAPSLEEHPEGYDYFDIDRIIDGSKHYCIGVEETHPVDTTENLGALRAFIKTEKAKLKAKKDTTSAVRLILINEEGCEIHVDAQFLLDMFEALPGATVTTSRTRPSTSGLYFKAENGDGVLLPLRPPKD